MARSRPIQTQNGRKFLTVVSLPAPDEFTSPATVELRSDENLGQVGDTVRCKVRIGGFRRSYDSQDPQTGDKVKVQTATVTLDVIG